MKEPCAGCGIGRSDLSPSQKDAEKRLCTECLNNEAMEIYKEYLKSKGKDPEKSKILQYYNKSKNQTKLF